MKKKVVVMFGGRSSEHEISIITGLEIVEALDTEKYQVLPLYIDLRGLWFVGDELRDKSIYNSLPSSLEKLQEVFLSPVPGASELQVISSPGEKSFSLFSKNKGDFIPVDVFYSAFHGQFGEDGCIQGLFELANVVYTGCGVNASAVAMNKSHSKSLLKSHGIASLPEIVVSKTEMMLDISALRNRIRSTPGLENFPLFIKPVHLGSSIAVGRADDEGELDGALAAVFERDEQALVEPCVQNLMEINVSVLEDLDGPRASVCEVPVASDNTLTYEDKYLRGGKGKKGAQQLSGMAGLTRVIDPEDLDKGIKQVVQEHATKAFQILGCSGVVRFDFMMDLESGGIYFNELNPLPGSLAHYLWAKSEPGLLYTEMLDICIEVALRNHERKQALRRDEGFRALG
jgi:D-alanine-D-alanine ligase